MVPYCSEAPAVVTLTAGSCCSCVVLQGFTAGTVTSGVTVVVSVWIVPDTGPVK